MGVVVGGDGKVHEVQITSGGTNLYVASQDFYFSDTRMHADMDATTAKRCSITLGI